MVGIFPLPPVLGLRKALQGRCLKFIQGSESITLQNLIKNFFQVVFQGEEAIDAGGPKKVLSFALLSLHLKTKHY